MSKPQVVAHALLVLLWTLIVVLSECDPHSDSDLIKLIAVIAWGVMIYCAAFWARMDRRTR